jgi:hypothetical protein
MQLCMYINTEFNLINSLYFILLKLILCVKKNFLTQNNICLYTKEENF